MRGTNNRIYGIGCLLVLVGGAGLAQIQMDSVGCFWLCAVVFSLGVAMCIGSYSK